jgi:hypothetical protein
MSSKIAFVDRLILTQVRHRFVVEGRPLDAATEARDGALIIALKASGYASYCATRPRFGLQA